MLGSSRVAKPFLSKNTNGAEMSNPRGVVAFAETSLGGVRLG